MKFFPAITAAAFLSTTALAIDEPLLPAWNGKERADLQAAGWVPGAILLSGDPVPDEPAKPAAEPLQVEQPKPGEIAEDLKPSSAIDEKFLPAYFAERPKNFLIDPQGLLSPSDYRDRLSFLNYHASDSSIDLFVYVIGGEQDIPGEVREEEMSERFFAEGRPAAIVYYYLGAPQRSVVYLSPSITDAISAAEQRRALESSVMQAFEKTQPAEQIEKFLVQMSIRIYWMERMIAGEPAVGDVLPPADAVTARGRQGGGKTREISPAASAGPGIGRSRRRAARSLGDRLRHQPLVAVPRPLPFPRVRGGAPSRRSPRCRGRRGHFVCQRRPAARLAARPGAGLFAAGLNVGKVGA